MSAHHAFLAGVIAAGYLMVAVSFIRFWRRTRDRLFAAFAFAFVLLAGNAAGPALLAVPDENASVFYFLRLIAFLAIVAAIVSKNLRWRR